MTLPGPNLTHKADRRRLLPSERLSMLRRSAVADISRACGAGLHLDPASRALGFRDGLAGIRGLSADDLQGRGRGIDNLAYLAGWVAGDRRRRLACPDA